MNRQPQLSVENLTVQYNLPGAKTLTAIEAVSLTLAPGETLAIVGESGCGKSTLARAICGLNTTTAGTVNLQGQRINVGGKPDFRKIGQQIQYIFQDPLDALDPRMTIGEILLEPLRNLFPAMTRKAQRQRIHRAIEEVALSPDHLRRYPHEFSGGQAQRIGIARALVSEPSILICDEPVSALDVSIQAQIINLLQQLQQDRQLSMLFISHDLRVVRHLADRVLVLYLGKVMEAASCKRLFTAPRHPYTQALLAAIPLPDPDQEKMRIQTVQPLAGDLPSPLDRPSGCVFSSRCPIADERCSSVKPEALSIARDHTLYCLKG